MAMAARLMLHMTAVSPHISAAACVFASSFGRNDVAGCCHHRKSGIPAEHEMRSRL